MSRRTGERAADKLRADTDVRVAALHEEAFARHRATAHIEEARACLCLSELIQEQGALRGRVAQLDVRLEARHRQRSHEAASLRSQHLDVVDALMRTKQCQAQQGRARAVRETLQDSLSRLERRLGAAEIRLPELELELRDSTAEFEKSVSNLSEDIGAVSCSVADLKMGLSDNCLRKVMLEPLVVEDQDYL